MPSKKTKSHYGVSACLTGVPCRWNGKSKKSKDVLGIIKDKEYTALCPEQLAGLPTPRPACEIIGGDGFDVLNKKAKIIGSDGKEYTNIYIKGAKKALETIKKNKIKKVILKSGSPSCGCGTIYDGSFKGKKKKGYGVFAALLRKNGIKMLELKTRRKK